jgi:serine/threonine-protein kinase
MPERLVVPPMSSPSQPTTDKIDSLLARVIAGNFRIEKLIGSGAMGNVYKAEQLSLGKAVAVKVLHRHLMGDDKLVMRFKREAKSASLLNHPNSIQIIDSGQDKDGTLYIAMELLDGRDLAHVIRDDFPLSLRRIVRIMSQVLSALDEAHAQGVIHRDLKPSNIMLIERRGEADFVKVCDFGIAKATQDSTTDSEAMLTIQGLVCGTPEYMAPEQARGEPLDGRADLYAAAVILFQMATGDIPFRGDTPMAIVSRHLVETPPIPSRKRADLPIPEALDALILRGMEKTREMRFASAAAFREELEAIGAAADGRFTSSPELRAQMPTARMSGAGEGGGRPGSEPRFGSTARMARQPRKLPLAGVIGGLSVVAALIGYRLQRTDRSPPTPAELAGVSQATRPSLAAATTPPPAAPPTATAPAPPPPPGSSAPLATAPAPLPAPSSPRPAHHKRAAEQAIAATAGPAAPATGKVVAPASPAAPDEAAAPAPRGPREAMAEGEKLLGTGEVKEACVRGEEAKRLGPKLAAPYKFLGKCYMRAGNAGQANDNYKKYLELAPNAPDAMFIKSIIK